ncbi:hypothetical protein [Campylobacter sp. P0109]|uniref:hypothetical protein n=1 Tax=Campylobacter sp. P0109 TaxID=1895606 RepID=UPI000BB3EAC0|nr:hypothetical protein [Campylobacter sp. P0109]
MEVQSSTRSIFLIKNILDNNINFYEIQYYEDMAFTIDYYLSCNLNHKVTYLPQCTYYIRKREAANSTMNRSGKDKAYYLDAINICLKTLLDSRNKNKGLFLHAQYSTFSMIIPN